jgi:hypothetical protein
VFSVFGMGINLRMFALDHTPNISWYSRPTFNYTIFVNGYQSIHNILVYILLTEFIYLAQVMLGHVEIVLNDHNSKLTHVLYKTLHIGQRQP